jgi:hypothetical protein
MNEMVAEMLHFCLDKGNLFRPQQFRELSTATIQEEAAPRLPKQ